jgi:hypothetical protein
MIWYDVVWYNIKFFIIYSYMLLQKPQVQLQGQHRNIRKMHNYKQQMKMEKKNESHA